MQNFQMLNYSPMPSLSRENEATTCKSFDQCDICCFYAKTQRHGELNDSYLRFTQARERLAALAMIHSNYDY